MFNIQRPARIPTSLIAPSPRYNAPDVLEALDRMQYGKCYICESRHESAIAVEHFDAEEDRYLWTNLYLSCHRCNSNLKGNRYNKLLDPADPNIDVVRSIRHEIPKSANSPVRIEKVFECDGIDTTVELLDKVFNLGDTGNRKLTRRNLRKQLFNVVAKFQQQLFVFSSEDSTPVEKEEAKNKIVHFLRNEQEYSAFLRWTVLDDEDLRVEFDSFIL